MGIFREPYVKQGKPAPHINNAVWEKIIAWYFHNPPASELECRADGSMAYAAVKRVNPYITLDDMTKDLIEREFITILCNQGFTCEHVENRVFKIRRRMWSMKLDVELMLPFGDAHIQAVINNYKHNDDRQAQERHFIDNP